MILLQLQTMLRYALNAPGLPVNIHPFHLMLLVQIFEDYRKIYEFGRDWNFAEYASKKQLSIREIRRDMHKQRDWRNELDKMKISQVPL